jgi:hypothetical protein
MNFELIPVAGCQIHSLGSLCTEIGFRIARGVGVCVLFRPVKRRGGFIRFTELFVV